MADFPLLVEAGWVKERLGSDRLVVLDASWYLPAQERDPEAEFAERHIPGALRFDFDTTVVDRASALPHMLPSAAEFEAHARALGVNAHSRIVVYDTAGVFAAPRAWWMFKAMGHGDVAVLSGGLAAWIAANGPLASGASSRPAQGDFVARPVRGRIVDLEHMKLVVGGDAGQILDARPAGRFAGREPEPRAGLRSGHMPGACNLPASDLVRDGRYKPADELAALFEVAGVDPAAPVIASCGSGVTACILALGGELAGLPPVAVYDGSWAEWGMPGDAGRPVVVG